MSEFLSVVRIPALLPPAPRVAAVWEENPSAALTRHFLWLRDTRMAGLPFLNDAIDVCVADCRRVGGDWLAAVVTPWSIVLVLLPGGGTVWQDAAPGVRCTIALPVGELVFIGEADPADDGAERARDVPAFLYCPLIAPPSDVADTDAACAIARDALQAALTVQRAAGGVAPELPPSTRRRAFLRGRI